MIKTTTANRYHDICCGHRVVGHESKCKNLHGHNYRFHFSIAAKDGLDSVGRVMDFSVIKHILCEWLEFHYDHKMLIWSEDPMLKSLRKINDEGIVVVSYNPTAENIAEYIMNRVAPMLLAGSDCYLKELTIEETRKCSVTVSI